MFDLIPEFLNASTNPEHQDLITKERGPTMLTLLNINALLLARAV